MATASDTAIADPIDFQEAAADADPLIMAKITLPDPPGALCLDKVTFTTVTFFCSPPFNHGYEQLNDEELNELGFDLSITYEIQQANHTKNTDFTTVLRTNSVVHTFQGLEMGTAYKYRLSCWNIQGRSAWSQVIFIETTDCRIIDGSQLYKAIKNRHDGWAIEIISRRPRLVHELLDGLHIALSVACAFGREKIVRKLLEYNPDVNFQVRDSGMSSLMEACISGNTECAALLIRYGAKWYLESRVGMTAIHYAALDGNTELVTILLNAGVPVDYIGLNDELQQTPLQCAARSMRDHNVVKILLDRNARINMQDSHGNTALILACDAPCTPNNRENLWIIENLIKYRANPFIRNNGGLRALHYARGAEKKNAVKLLELYNKECLLLSLIRQIYNTLRMIELTNQSKSSTESASSTESTESASSTESTESASSTESTESASSTESTESASSTESTESASSTEPKPSANPEPGADPKPESESPTGHIKCVSQPLPESELEPSIQAFEQSIQALGSDDEQ